MSNPSFNLPSNISDEPFTDDELEAHLGDNPVETVEKFAVNNMRKAEWAMRKLVEQQAQIDEIAEQARLWIEEIEVWQEAQSKRPKAFSDYLTAQLTEYQQARLEDDPKAKTLSLPSGKVTTTDRRHLATVQVLDPEVFAEWAVENLPDEVVEQVIPVQPPKVLPSKLGDSLVTRQTDEGWVVMSPEGELVPGVEAKPGSLTIKAVPNKAGR